MSEGKHDFEPHLDHTIAFSPSTRRIVPVGIVHGPTPESEREYAIKLAEQGEHVVGLDGEIQHHPKGSGRLHGHSGVNWNTEDKKMEDKSTRWVPTGSAWKNLQGNPSSN